MILHALYRFYEAQRARPEGISEDGWSEESVHGAILLTRQGEFQGVAPYTSTEVFRNGKSVERSGLLTRVPFQAKRTSDIKPYFLCDTPAYLLGFTSVESRQKRTALYHAASLEYHRDILSRADSEVAHAILAFFDRWEPEFIDNHSQAKAFLENLNSSSKLVFEVEAAPAHRDPMVVEAWLEAREADVTGEGICLVTGKHGHIVRVLPSVQGVEGTAASGGSLVSFNAPVYESYGQEKGDNASISLEASHACIAALSHLLKRRIVIGDTTLVYWSENAEPTYGELMVDYLLGNGSEDAEDIESMLERVLRAIRQGKGIDHRAMELNPDMPFYILGLTGEQGRVTVRYLHVNSFGEFLRNILMHHERLTMVRPASDKRVYLSIQDLIKAVTLKQIKKKTSQQSAEDTVSDLMVQNQKKKDAGSVGLEDELLRSILYNRSYPAKLHNLCLKRIGAERTVNRARAAILKAFQCQFSSALQEEKEVPTVALNPDNNQAPYLLGRVLAVLERIQIDSMGRSTFSSTNENDVEESTNGKAGKSKEDRGGVYIPSMNKRFFTLAAKSPALALSSMLQLSQHHQSRLASQNPGLAVVRTRLLAQLIERLGDNVPARFSRPEQSVFYVGYYQQQQAFFEPKKTKKDKEA